MIKKTITYQNYNDETVTKDFYFNLSTAEVIRKDAENNLEGGYQAFLQRMVESNDGRQLLPAFEDFVKDAYGERSIDGSEFYKTEAGFERFKASGAFDGLFLEFLTDPVFAAEFVRGVMPSPKALAQAADNITSAASGPRKPQDHLPSAREQFAQRNAQNVAETAGTTDVNTTISPDGSNGYLRKEVRDLYSAGKNFIQIAEELDLKPSEVRAILDAPASNV